MQTQEFGAYLQCYKNPYATYKCLESFRTFYPDNTIVLLSDNGYDYTKMAEYFKCIYIHSNENIHSYMTTRIILVSLKIHLN